MVWFISWLFLTAVVSFMAKSFNRSAVGYFFLALFLSPLIGIIALLFSGKKGKSCPKCAELVKVEASKCKHCGHEFTEQAKSA